MNIMGGDHSPCSLILDLLNEYSQGLTIKDIASHLGLNRNLTAKNLSILHMQGRVDLRSYGKVKLYRISQRIPFHSLSLVTNGCVIGLDQLLCVKEILGRCKETIGTDKDVLIYRPYSEICHPVFHDPIVRNYLFEYKSGYPPSPLHKEILWNNQVFTLTIAPCIFDDGNCGLALVLSDISGINASSIEYKQTKRAYHHLSREIPDFIAHFNMEGELLYINESYVRYCGKDQDELLHTVGIPLATHDDFSIICEGVRRTVAEESTTPYDIRVVMGDGDIRWQRWIFYPVFEGPFLIEMHGYGRDITDEREKSAYYLRLEKDFKEAVSEKSSELREVTAILRREIDERKVLEVALKKKEEQYRNLTEITTDMILEVDCHGIIVYVNPQVYHVLGFHPPEVIGTVIWDFVVTEKRVSIKRFFSQNTGYQFEQVSIPLNHRNGSEVWVEFSGVPFFDENQQLSGYRGIGRDVTKSVAIETYNRRLQAIIESTPDIVRISDIKGDILYINKAGRKILNIPDETDITTLNNSDYMDPEDWSKILLGRQTAIENGIWQGITTLRATDGTKIPVSQVIIPHSTGKGDELIFSTVARDITEITQFQEILENDYLYTRSLIEANPDPLITIGSGGEIQDVNHATEQVTGYSREELIGTDFCTYFSDPKSARKGYKQVFSDGFVKNYPLEILHYDGHVSPVLYNATLYRDRSGAVQGVFAAARDISAIKNTEQQLAESRDYYLKILDNFPNPIWRSDTSAKCDYFNKAWLSFTGKTIKEEMGDGWVKGVHPEDLDRCIALYRSSFDQREPFFMIYRLLHNDGSYHRIADYGSPIFDVKGEFSGYIGSCYDLDEVEVQ